MAKKFLVSLDLTKNEIQNVVIHKLATAPTSPVEGQIYHNTGDGRTYMRISAAWKDITGRLDDVLSGTTALSKVDNGNGTVTLSIANADGTNSGLLTSAFFNDLTNATSAATASTLVERDGSGNSAFNAVTLTSGTVANAPVNPTDIANKSYVDGLLTAGMSIIGLIDCSANPNYPAASVGDAYHVSVGGLIGGGAGELVEVGDVILCITASAGGTEAAVGSEFIVLQANTDAATETIAGTIRIATTAEINAGTDNATAVTPAKLAAYVAAQVTAGKYAALVGTGAATSIVVTHSLGTVDVGVTVKDAATLELVECDIVITDTNTVTLGFVVAPASNAYRVVVQG